MTNEMITEIANEIAAEATTAAAQGDLGTLKFSLENFLSSLPIMGKGMLGIFLVTIVIILVVGALNKFTAPKAKNKEQK